MEHAPRRSKFAKRAVSKGYSRRDTILKQVDPFLSSRYKTGCANASSECIASLLPSPTVCRSLRDLRENNDRYFVLRTSMYLCTCYAIISSCCTATDITYEIHTSGIKHVRRKRNRIDKQILYFTRPFHLFMYTYNIYWQTGYSMVLNSLFYEFIDGRDAKRRHAACGMLNFSDRAIVTTNVSISVSNFPSESACFVF